MKSFNTQINIDESLLEKKFIVCDRHGTTEALFNNSCLQCFQEEENKLKEIEELKVFSDKQTRSGIVVNSIYRNATFDNYFCNNNEQKQFKETLDSYNYNSNLILSGNCGTGKTHLAIALVNRALKTEKQCYYIAFYEIAKIYVKNSVLFDYLINVDFLVIDEFGIQDTEFKSGLLFEILDKRAIINKPTCLITNLDIKEFTDRISIAVQSRLKINCTVVQGMDWQDYRIHKNN